MGRFHSCKPVVERALRRSFYDAVLELYEGHGSSDTVTAVSLEGTLTLTINKAETLTIRLNEVAQRAEENSLDDCVQNSLDTKHADRGSEPSGKKRKQVVLGGNEEREKTAIVKKEPKVERLRTEPKCLDSTAEISVKYEEGINRPSTSSQNSLSHVIKVTDTSVADCETSVSAQGIKVKREPEEHLEVPVSLVLPGPSISRTEAEEDAQSTSGDPVAFSPKGKDLSFSAEVKKEPMVESILIEDDDEDDSSADMGGHTYSSMPQTSPVHSLWYKRPRVSKQCDPSKGGDQSHKKHSPSAQEMNTVDPHKMAMLLERSDCPLCGEVLHSRKELSSHLHAHRHVLRSTCSVCLANTLTLDALLLHFSVMHSPRPVSLSATTASDTLLSQALVPTLPYAHAPMSAIASLVSMAACQAGPSSSTFLGGGMVGGVSSLMEQLMACRSLLPCPVCQLLCSSRQQLATHLMLMHGIAMPGGGVVAGGQDEGLTEEAGIEAPSDTHAHNKQDSDADRSVSANFSCFDCSLEFSSQALFRQHCLLQHNTTSVVTQGSCSVCHRTFDTWKTLHSHYLAAHAISNFCDRCKMGFVSAAELKTHYDSMHASDSRGLTFICDICNKGFYSQSQCSAHKRSHISEKSFACQVCGSAFFKRGDLSKHFRTVHAPNRVFACRFCGKRGTRMDNMRSHVKSHGKHMTRDEVLSFIEEVKS